LLFSFFSFPPLTFLFNPGYSEHPCFSSGFFMTGLRAGLCRMTNNVRGEGSFFFFSPGPPPLFMTMACSDARGHGRSLFHLNSITPVSTDRRRFPSPLFFPVMGKKSGFSPSFYKIFPVVRICFSGSLFAPPLFWVGSGFSEYNLRLLTRFFTFLLIPRLSEVVRSVLFSSPPLLVLS